MSRSTRWSTRASATLACAALLAGVAAHADPVRVPAYVRAYISDARVAGPGRLTWFGFHVYDANIYVSHGFDARAPFGQPFALELKYARALDGRAIADASRDEIARLGFGTEEQRERWHAWMTALFPDVERGQKLAGVYLPGVGARFYFDGRLRGAIEDPEFARAFFSIWLDERTRAPRLRDSLMQQLEVQR
ncbi:MAG: chalcone isomerase family protein [Gemmatimonadota bacterium]